MKTVNISVSLTDDGTFNLDAPAAEGVSALDQSRTLMLAIYVLCQQQIGERPDDEVIDSLRSWAENVLG